MFGCERPSAEDLCPQGPPCHATFQAGRHLVTVPVLVKSGTLSIGFTEFFSIYILTLVKGTYAASLIKRTFFFYHFSHTANTFPVDKL